jgi:DNA-binding MarR family transcriptional regulator
VAEPFARSVHGISTRAVAVADAVRALYAAKGDKKTPHVEAYVTVRELAKELRWAKRTVHKWVEQAEGADLIEIRSEEKGKAMKIWPTEQKASYTFALLPDPAAVAAALKTSIRVPT